MRVSVRLRCPWIIISGGASQETRLIRESGGQHIYERIAADVGLFEAVFGGALGVMRPLGFSCGLRRSTRELSPPLSVLTLGMLASPASAIGRGVEVHEMRAPLVVGALDDLHRRHGRP
jgi:hypothetical protein